MTNKFHPNKHVDEMYPGHFYSHCDEHGDYRTSKFPVECPKCTEDLQAAKLWSTKQGEACRRCGMGTMFHIDKKLMVGKVSRKIYICDECGFESV